MTTVMSTQTHSLQMLFLHTSKIFNENSSFSFTYQQELKENSSISLSVSCGNLDFWETHQLALFGNINTAPVRECTPELSDNIIFTDIFA